jgi:hypothetical protein
VHGRCEDDVTVDKAELERQKEAADEKKNKANKARQEAFVFFFSLYSPPLSSFLFCRPCFLLPFYLVSFSLSCPLTSEFVKLDLYIGPPSNV